MSGIGQPEQPANRALPPWLDPYELVAWVKYRNIAIVAKATAKGWWGLAGQDVFGKSKAGNTADLLQALQCGKLPAQGQKRDQAFKPIPAVEWTRIMLAPLDLSRQLPYELIRFKRGDVLRIFPQLGAESECLPRDNSAEKIQPVAVDKNDRAPSVKAGRPPGNDDILAKADEMKARGLDGRTIAKTMRLEAGFENTPTTLVRELLEGRWPRGRPKKPV